MSDKINVVIDATSLDTFLSCPAKYNFRFNLLKVTEIKAEPLDRGTLAHNGFEYYFRALQAKESFDDAVKSGIERIHFTASGDESDLDPEKVNELTTAFSESCNKWRYLDEQLEIVSIEEPFSKVLFEDESMRIIYIGKIDLLVNHPPGFPILPNVSHIPYDHKTYSRDSQLNRTANQFSGYAWATDSSYLIVNRVGLQKSIKPEIKHKRIPLSYDELFLDGWRKNTIKILRYYVDCAVNNEWPANFTSCDKYNRLCEYHEVCDSSGEDSKVFKLATNFKTAERWDVSASLGKKE